MSCAWSVALVGLDDLQPLVAGVAGVPRIERVLLGHARRRAADVERAHRQLRARLADRLRGDDADRLAQLHHPSGGQVAAVAPRAHAAARRAGEHRADADLLDARFLHRRGLVLVDLAVELDDRLVGERIGDPLERDAADDAVAQRLDDLARLDDGAGLDAVERAAVVLGDDDVLRHVHQTPGQIAGVGGLERRVGQTLAGAVRRDEVLLHGEAFTEVRRDRRLDDLARRLGHQAAHAGELPDLLLRAAGARVGHDVDRVEAPARPIELGHLAEHLVGDLLGDLRPHGDDLVVALAVGDGALEVLLLDLDHLAAGVAHQLRLVAPESPGRRCRSTAPTASRR